MKTFKSYLNEARINETPNWNYDARTNTSFTKIQEIMTQLQQIMQEMGPSLKPDSINALQQAYKSLEQFTHSL